MVLKCIKDIHCFKKGQILKHCKYYDDTRYLIPFFNWAKYNEVKPNRLQQSFLQYTENFEELHYETCCICNDELVEGEIHLYEKYRKDEERKYWEPYNWTKKVICQDCWNEFTKASVKPNALALGSHQSNAEIAVKNICKGLKKNG